MPSASRKKSRPKPGTSRHARPATKAAGRKARSTARPAAAPAKRPAVKPVEPPAPAPLVPRGGDARRHVLSLSFLRDGDEFLARMETDSGQITELKNRSLDQLLTLVASELEDLLE